MKLFAATMCLFAYGCGTENGSSQSQKPDTGQNVPQNDSPDIYSMFVSDAGALPACSTTNQGQLVYVKSEAQFKACDGGSWSTVSIQGPAGPAGEIGPSGPAGDVSENKIGSSIYCAAGLQNTSLSFIYNAVQMTSGDVFVDGAIGGVSFQISGSVYYSPKQVGYASAPLEIRYDVEGTANGGDFTLSLNRSSLVVSVSYTDPDGNLSWSLTADKCVLNTY